MLSAIGRNRVSPLVVALLLLFVFTAPAAAFTTTQTLTESSPVAGDGFGTSVAIDGSTMVVGAPDAGPEQQGEVDIYTQASDGKWTFLQTLTGVDAQAEDFGEAVAISGNTIVVGAPGGSSKYDEGSVWIYTRTSSSGLWPTSGQTIAATQTMEDLGDEFGYSVAISGNLLAVGEPGVDDYQGEAFVYTTTSQYGYDADNPAILLDPSSGDDEFGNAVAISGNTVFVGAPGTMICPGAPDTCMSESGQVYDETDVPASGDDWTNTTLNALPGATGTSASYGSALAVQGATLVVGVPGAGGGMGGAEGEGYAFNIAKVATTTPTTIGVLQPAESADTSPQFGSTVAVYGSTVALGSGTSAGTACLTSTSAPSVCGALASGLYGGGVALSATTALAGGPLVNSEEGEVESFFTKPPPTAAQILATLKGLLSPSHKTIKQLYKAGSYSFNYTALEKGQLTIAWYDSRTEVADGTVSYTAAGKHTIKVSLTKAGKKLFKSAHKLTLKSALSFTPSGGKAVTAGKSFTLR
jgi:FG-GAP repeat protein